MGTAVFIGKDSTTRGSWHGVYGSLGYEIEGDATSLPSDVTVSVNGSPSTFDYGNTTNLEGLENAANTARLQHIWYRNDGSPWNLEVDISDATEYCLSVYMADYGGGEAPNMTVEVIDAATSTVLDTQTIDGNSLGVDFRDGDWLRWNITGDVKVVFQRASSANALASGLFLDAPATVPSSAGAPVVCIMQ